jgi:hypothetical protein
MLFRSALEMPRSSANERNEKAPKSAIRFMGIVLRIRFTQMLQAPVTPIETAELLECHLTKQVVSIRQFSLTAYVTNSTGL